jgi:hypothetical protein
MRRWIRLFAGPAAFLLLININWASTLEFKLDGTDWKLTPLMPSEWEARSVWDENWNPRAGNASAPDWLPATVPGDVVRDSVDAGLVPQPYLDANSRACEWLAQRDWVYR